jgi:hypothetical protein
MALLKDGRYGASNFGRQGFTADGRGAEPQLRALADVVGGDLSMSVYMSRNPSV